MEHAAQIAEIHRRLANLIRTGLVEEIDHASALCRVRTGDLVTDWLPWFARRAGETATWSPLTVGEQVMILSPSGELSAGYVLTGLYSDSVPAPSEDPAEHITEYPDGCVVHYNHETHTLEATGLKIAHLQASESVTVDTKTAVVNASESATITTKTAMVEASASATIKSVHVTLDTPTTDVTGVMNVTGLVTCGGITTKGGAAAKFTGPVTAEQPVTAQSGLQLQGDLVNNGINLTSHKHLDSRGGNTGGPQ